MSESLSVAMVCPYSFARAGGVQNHVLGLAGWLKGQGHQVSLLGPGHPDQATMAASGLDESDFTSAGRAIPVPYNGSVARVNFGPTESWRVKRWLRRIDPHVLHVHEPITPSVSVLSTWHARMPVVATFHTATPGSKSMALARRALPRTIAGISQGIAVSTVARQVVRDHIGLDPHVIGNGITVGAEPADLGRTGWRGGAVPRVTFVGRYDEPRKGFEVLVDALPRLRARFPGIDVVIVGEGTRREVPGARFVGYLSDAERDLLLSRSDVYVAPHRGRESFGIVILEALAAGTNVVASSLPAFREVLTTGTGELVGRLVTVEDADHLADEVTSALDSTGEPGDIRRRQLGWQHALSFDWSVIGPRVADIYQQALTGPHQQSAKRGSGPLGARRIA